MEKVGLKIRFIKISNKNEEVFMYSKQYKKTAATAVAVFLGKNIPAVSPPAHSPP